jgi:hypothetical protein
LLLVAACFGEGDPVASGTSGGGCPDGSVGCACYGNGSCDEGLRCASEVDLCIHDDPGCTPGTLGCSCDGDACNDGSVCIGGFCGMGGGGSDTGASSVGTTASTTASTASSTMGDPSTTGIDTGGDTDVMTSGSVSDSLTTDASASTTAAETGDPFGCYDCVEAQKVGPCAQQWNECSMTDCATMVDEYNGCLLSGFSCGQQICESYCGNGQPLYCGTYETFADCTQEHCSDVCVELGCT